jgi:hypothetical protein
VVLTGEFDESPSVTVTLETSDSGSATGNVISLRRLHFQIT